PGEGFGDTDSGWKNRLQFPSATPKTTEPEPEIEIPPAGKKGFRDLFRSDKKPRKSEPEFDRPLPAGVPPDITSEEIAAIAAAASVPEAKSETPQAASPKKLSEPNQPTAAAASSASSDAEVMAALHSLDPQASDSTTGSLDASKSDEPAPAKAPASGPRWIAEV